MSIYVLFPVLLMSSDYILILIKHPDAFSWSYATTTLISFYIFIALLLYSILYPSSPNEIKKRNEYKKNIGLLCILFFLNYINI